jgi:hypothetical protein
MVGLGCIDRAARWTLGRQNLILIPDLGAESPARQVRGFLSLGALILALFLFSPDAFAKLTNGKVSAVDTQTRKLTVHSEDVATGRPVELEIWVNEDAAFTGTESLASLKAGDAVWVEAEQDPEGNWKASKVTKAS